MAIMDIFYVNIGFKISKINKRKGIEKISSKGEHRTIDTTTIRTTLQEAQNDIHLKRRILARNKKLNSHHVDITNFEIIKKIGFTNK